MITNRPTLKIRNAIYRPMYGIFYTWVIKQFFRASHSVNFNRPIVKLMMMFMNKL